ncbi:MAG: acyl-CoA dehydrogenase family protein [Alphaproteobacteria bacterium]|nr:acyl-CoA dehydrogenase family protein [Alphaproteobacteria bacterium]
MQISPIPGLADDINEIRLKTAAIVNEEIIPNEPVLGQGGEDAHKIRERIRARVRREGLWAPHLPKEYGGMGIGFLKHAYMNEVMAFSPFSARLFGVEAPNAGNAKILVKYGSPEQKRDWLEPLVRGEMESCFSMTEPNSSGSDPRSLKTTAVRDGNEWVINGHKWFTSNGRRADFAIVMCRTEDEGGRNDKMTQIIVPMKSEGVNIVRSVPVWGHTHGDHCEIKYENVRVPITNQLGERGTGHKAAQDRLGAGRVFHCMNAVGGMWRAFDLMNRRALSREVFGGKLAEKQFIQGFIAESYMDIQTSRLLTIHTANVIESGGDPRTDISALKVYVPNAYQRVVDRAIQVYGGMGVSGDLPLAGMFTGARTLRIADGADEVHKILIARNVLRVYKEGRTWDFGL